MKENIIYETQLNYFSKNLFKLNIFNISKVYLDYLEHLKYLAKIYNGIFKYHNEPVNDLVSNIKMCVPESENETDINIFSVIYDIWVENYIYHQKKSFESYNITQPLFVRHPEMFHKISKNGKLEYFSSNQLEYIGLLSDENYNNFLGFKYKETIFEVPEGSSLTMNALYDFLISEYPYIEIKVSPHHIHISKNISNIFRKGMIKPISPRCINKFILLKGYSGGVYDFSFPNPKFENLNIYKFEYLLSSKKSSRVKRLEVIIKHRKKDMSMMFEEICVDDFHQQVIGRCVHLDILNAYEKDLTEMKLSHIDLAFNTYLQDNMIKRLSQSLSNGKKVTNADYRTHLIRLENIPFLDIIKIVYLFMESKSLVIDWIDNQFGDSINIRDFVE